MLRAAREYIDFGPVARVEELAVSAEVFNDLLAIAERHCAAGRGGAAAVLAAAILEDVLWRNARNRKLAIREHIDGPASLNQKLWQAGVYPAAMKNKIDRWMSLGYGAAAADAAAGRTVSGAATVVEPMVEMVTEMITGVRNFVADYLT